MKTNQYMTLPLPAGPQVCLKYSVPVTFSPTLFHIVEIVHVILTVSRQHSPAAVLGSGVDISRFYWSWYLQVLPELISPGSTGVEISRFYWSWYLQVLPELISPGFTGVEISRFLLHTSSSNVSFYFKPWNYEKNGYLKCWQFRLFRNAGTERTQVREFM